MLSMHGISNGSMRPTILNGRIKIGCVTGDPKTNRAKPTQKTETSGVGTLTPTSACEALNVR